MGILRKESRVTKQILLTIIIIMGIIMTSQKVEATNYKDVIANNSEFKSSVYYIIDGTMYFKSGRSVTETKIDSLLQGIKLFSKSRYTESGNGGFKDTEIFKGWKYTGNLEKYDYLEDSFGSLIYNTSSNHGIIEIVTESNYKIALPLGSVRVQDKETGEWYWERKSSYYRGKDDVEYTLGKAADGASAIYFDIIKAMKEGVIVGGVTHGINVGVAFADEPIDINKVMDERPAKGIRIVGGKREEYEIGGKVWEFNASAKKEAVMEYFMSPILGKMELSEVPTTEDAWDEKADEVKISGNTVHIDTIYQQFLDQEASSETGLKPSEGTVFENGVEKYKRENIESETPKSYLDYNMRIIVPTIFYRSSQSRFQALKEGETAVSKTIEGYRLSVYNDKMHEMAGDELTLYCTLNDLDVTRDYIQLYHYIDDAGEKKGAVLVLRYDEGVADVNEQSVYITGRKVHFGGNYMTGMVVDTANRDSLYTTTKITGKTGIVPRAISFPITGGVVDETGVLDIYGDTKYHTEINKNHEYIYFSIDFRTVKVDSSTIVEGAEEVTDSGYTGPEKRFVMTRNNFYVNDGELLDWLRTDEAQGMKGVLAEELRKKIQGQTGEFEAIKFADWLRMEEIKSQLRKDKDAIVPRAIGTLMILFGTFFIVVGIILPFIYLFDIFNTVTELSIIYIISSGRMYPVEHKDSMIPQGLLNETMLVDFKDIAKIVVIMVLIGGLFYEIDTVIVLIYRLYGYISQFVR